MTDNNPHLNIFNPGDEEARQAEIMQQLAEQEFCFGTFDRALERREFMLEHDLDVPEFDETQHSLEEKGQMAAGHMLRYLEERGAVLPLQSIDPEFTAELLSLWQKISMNFGLTEFMSNADNPALPYENIEKHIQTASDLLHRVSQTVCGQERLLVRLRDQGVSIRNSDLARILIHDHNKMRMYPEVLVLKNKYKRYQPFYVKLEGVDGTNSELRGLFSLFAY